MNQLVELPKTSGELVTINPQTYVAAAYESFLARFEGAVKQYGEVTYNITTKTGMETAKAARAAFRDIRTGTEKKRVECKAPIIEIGKLLDSRAKEITAQIEPHESRFDTDIKAEEKRLDDEKAARIKAEAERQSAIQREIDGIKNMPISAINMDSVSLQLVIDGLASREADEATFGERFVEGEIAIKATLEQLRGMLDGKKAQEQLAAQQEAQRIENERIARELAEAKAIEEARQRAAQEAEAARIKVEREALERERAELNKARQEIEAQKAEQERMQAAEEAKARAKVEAEKRAAEDTSAILAGMVQEEKNKAAREAEEETRKAEAAKHVTQHLVAGKPVEPELQTGPGTIFHARFGKEHDKPARPSDNQIIAVLSEHYRVHESKVIEWLLDVDLRAASERMAKEFA